MRIMYCTEIDEKIETILLYEGNDIIIRYKEDDHACIIGEDDGVLSMNTVKIDGQHYLMID